MPRLVLIETMSNQRYIFASNRLRENAGASEIVYLAGTRLVVDAIGAVAGENNPYHSLSETGTTRERVERIVEIGETQDPLQSCGVEIIVSTSGKAILLVDDHGGKTGRQLGEDIIWQVTTNALKHYPGLSILGIVGEEFDHENGGIDVAHKAVKQVHIDIEALKSRLPSPLARFPANPFVQPCHSSGLPAQRLAREANVKSAKKHPYCAVTLKKREIGKDGFKRIAADIGRDDLAHNPNTLDRMEELDWVAIVHADGNGFGKLFLGFDSQPGVKDLTSATEYLKKFRRFSASLELCGLEAFGKAVADVPLREVDKGRAEEESYRAIVPLILGGDDLTVVMDGRYALKFTQAYLLAFEEATSAPDFAGFPNEIRKVTGGATLGAGAGVAVVKPHYPFHRAYELAEALLGSAKKTKTRLGTPSISAMDFHIMFDTGATTLNEIRAALSNHDGSRLTLRPYVVSENARDKVAQGQEWILPRRWADLCNNIEAIMSVAGPKEGAMPSSQLHALREALFSGEKVAEARLNLIRHRYLDIPGASFGRDGSLFADNGELFADNGEPGEEKARATTLLDMMEVIDLEGHTEMARQEVSG